MRRQTRLILSIIILGFGITTGGCDQTSICQVLEGMGVGCGSLNGNSNANDNSANDNTANGNTNDNTTNGNTNDNGSNDNNVNDNT